MQIVTNEKSEIIAYASLGKMENGIETVVPDDFVQAFVPSYYLYSNGTVTINPNYVAPVPTDKSNDDPSAAMAAINALGIQVAQLTAKVEAQAGGAN